MKRSTIMKYLFILLDKNVNTIDKILIKMEKLEEKKMEELRLKTKNKPV